MTSVRDPFERLEESASVACPFCGETVEIAVDLGGAAYQEYVEDCQVCCRPWQVTVRIQRDGTPWVEVSALDQG